MFFLNNKYCVPPVIFFTPWSPSIDDYRTFVEEFIEFVHTTEAEKMQSIIKVYLVVMFKKMEIKKKITPIRNKG